MGSTHLDQERLLKRIEAINLLKQIDFPGAFHGKSELSQILALTK